MINIVYLTINTVNRKIYIGVHQTEDDSKFDYYLGNGVYTNKVINNPKTPFQEAVKKYGVKVFERITLFRCNSREEALEIEAHLVNEDFIQRKDVYNVTVGGGNPPLLNKQVYQYSLEGDFINEFESVKEAGEFVGSAFSGVISNACNYKTISYGYLWSYEKVDKLDIDDFNINVQKVKVHVYDFDRTYLKSFETLSECSKELNIGKIQTITNAIYSGKKVKNWYFSTALYDELPIVKQLDNTCSIYQYSLDGNYIRSFSNLKELKKFYSFTKDRLEMAIYQSKPMLEFRWSLLKTNKLEELNDFKITNSGKRIGQYTLEGELVKIFNTVREARKEFGNVSKVLSNKVNHCKGFTFKYIE